MRNNPPCKQIDVSANRLILRSPGVTARHAVREQDCVLSPLRIVTAIVISHSYRRVYEKAEAFDRRVTPMRVHKPGGLI